MSGRTPMTTLEEIEKAVESLPRPQLAAFHAWFAEFVAAAWDRQFEEDVKAGRLDKLGQEALEDLRAGRCRDL